ncbi:hypothetical protein V6N13_142161 [Hibiscus sabdariffa]|uniref:Uncharacterized protein n=1 Tax=Hibiscus sabdariffa TaxID=183260 RepID=A0ABR2FDB0_9ROSI
MTEPMKKKGNEKMKIKRFLAMGIDFRWPCEVEPSSSDTSRLQRRVDGSERSQDAFVLNNRAKGYSCGWLPAFEFIGVVVTHAASFYSKDGFVGQ